MFIIVPINASAQDRADSLITDTVPNPLADSLHTVSDTLATSLTSDSLELKKKADNSVISSNIEYSADDSIDNDVVNRKVYLYGNAQIKYQDITLKAALIEYDFLNYTVHAEGVQDTSGNWVGLPDFKQGSSTFTSHEMNYNFRSKKAFVRQVQTDVIEGTLTGSEVKTTDNNNIIYVRHGEYCPCEDPNAKTRFKIGRLKVIKDKEIVTGPGYMVIGKIPTPLAFPFGFFPNSDKRQAGLIFPSYGNGGKRGYFLTNLGFYIPLGEMWDTKFLADIYSRGSWGLKNETNYNKRYKYNGGFGLQFNKTVTGDRDLNNYTAGNQFFIRWNHKQDMKARPNSNFSASVNAGSSQNYRNDLNASQENYLQNTFQSNITYSKSFYDSPWSLGLNAGHSQNSQTGVYTFTLPSLTINRATTMPLDGLFNNNPKQAIYEKLAVTYSATAANRLKTTESELALNNFGNLKDEFQNGVNHNASVSLPLNAGALSISPSFNYQERWYLKTFGRTFDDDLGMYETDTIGGFNRNYNYNFSASMTTKLYGMFSFKKGPIKAIRHTITPNLRYTVTPDFNSNVYGFYNTDGSLGSYSPYEGTLYGGPPSGRSELLTFSLTNNLEAKVLSKRDTTSKYTKISLIDNFSASSSYDFQKDSLNLTPIGLSLRTKITKYLDLTANGIFQPYAYVADAANNGRPIIEDVFLVRQTGKLASFESGRLSLNGRGFGSEMYAKKPPGNIVSADDDEIDTEITAPLITAKKGLFEDFTVPWHVGFGYSLTANRGRKSIELPEGYAIVDSIKFIQSIVFNGDFRLFNKVSVNINSGYDFVSHEFTPTNINMTVDLNCWEFGAQVIPFGDRKSYSIRFNIKSSMLRDLKLEKKDSFGRGNNFFL